MDEQKPLVDLDFGLSQLGGNAELLNKMLIKFKEQFKDTPAQVTQQLKDGDYDAAKMRIHTAKGITGNLGLRALFDCCKAFDAKLKQRQAAPEILEQFTKLMHDTCLAIDAHSQLVAPGAAADQANHLEEAKPQLIELLSRHEFIDDGLLRDLVGSIDMSDEEKDVLIDLIEQLQYEKAIMMLKH
ncbi:Hpt domain-containing protein [Glaciecola sp. SC05]|uniref:Hpt domain-containing protein n=1 Tax=Glaciecola sp. SC05 TaxID=1987355 RepID=UPI0035292A0B